MHRYAIDLIGRKASFIGSTERALKEDKGGKGDESGQAASFIGSTERALKARVLALLFSVGAEASFIGSTERALKVACRTGGMKSDRRSFIHRLNRESTESL